MFNQWKIKIVAIGSFVAFVIGVLGFFDVKAKDLRDALTTHYLWGLLAVVSFVGFVWGCYLWTRSGRTTAENVRSKISEWLDGYGFQRAVITDFSAWHFGYRVTVPGGPLLFIAREVAREESILFRGLITAVSSKHRPAYNNLSEREQEELYHTLTLETARARFVFRGDQALNQVSFDKSIPIKYLTASTFIQTIDQMYFSANILWSSIALQLGGKPARVMVPSSTPDTGTLQPPQE